MPCRLLSGPAALGAALSLVSVSALCAAGEPPAVPPVVEIPVAPLPRPRRVPASAPAPSPAPTTLTTTTVTTTTPVPPLAAITVEPTPPARVGATEAMPALPSPAGAAAASPAAPAHVVLVDEEPFRASHTHAREVPEHSSRHGKKHGRHGRPYHPAPGIVVDVPEANGGANAADLQRLARSVGYWPFRHCYEEGLRRDQHMAGHVTMDLAVAPGGAVDRAALTGASLHDESTVLCVAREASHLALAPAQGATTAKLDVTLSTGDEPVPMPHVLPHADELREALRASWPAVRQCYASGVARHADDGGRMELAFHVRSHGEIDEVSEGETRFADVDVTKCVLGVYRGVKLPAGHGSHETRFVYALHFEARPAAPAAQ
jgi:hypothetical protein